MSYKTGRGNVAKKSLRFHAAVKMVFDYQSVTKHPVAASRQLAPEVNHGDVCVDLGHAPAWVKPLEVRCAHPVRLSPATHSQGHGRPCLQRSHPSRDFYATWYCHLTVPYWAITCASPGSVSLWTRWRTHCHGHVLPALLAEPWF